MNKRTSQKSPRRPFWLIYRDRNRTGANQQRTAADAPAMTIMLDKPTMPPREAEADAVLTESVRAVRPRWLLPTYNVARPVIWCLAALFGVTAAFVAGSALHVGTTAVAAIAALTSIGIDAGLRHLRFRLLDSRSSTRLELAEIYNRMVDKAQATALAEMVIKDEPITEYVIELVRVKVREREQQHAAWAAVKQAVASYSIPSCPSWCTEGDGHGYHPVDDDGNARRSHEAIVVEGNPDSDSAIRIMQEEERTQDGAVTLGAPEIYAEVGLTEPAQVQAFGSALSNSTAMLEALILTRPTD